jgi:hypothetical protein
VEILVAENNLGCFYNTGWTEGGELGDKRRVWSAPGVEKMNPMKCMVAMSIDWGFAGGISGVLR